MKQRRVVNRWGTKKLYPELWTVDRERGFYTEAGVAIRTVIRVDSGGSGNFGSRAAGASVLAREPMSGGGRLVSFLRRQAGV